jgi:hypothetical protein
MWIRDLPFQEVPMEMGALLYPSNIAVYFFEAGTSPRFYRVKKDIKR